MGALSIGPSPQVTPRPAEQTQFPFPPAAHMQLPTSAGPSRPQTPGLSSISFVPLLN